MKLKPIYLFSILVALVLAVALPFAVPERSEEPPTEDLSMMTPTDTQPAVTEKPTDPVPTEPQPEVFTLSFVGDCTLGCTDADRAATSSFSSVVGEDYDYPLANVRDIFESDDFTLANLEGPLTENGTPMDKQFVFRGPPAYAAILSGSSVEAVTTANNHFYDYGDVGMLDTNAALDAAGIKHAWRGSFLYTTETGLTIGVYCDDFSFDQSHMEESFAEMREMGAEVIVCAFHWGEEYAYTPNYNQTTWAHIAIDAGADIVAGHHPHVLQPMEVYNGGVIFYSLGNFCFGGNPWPGDMDSAIVQQQVIRDPEGNVSLGETIIIPCSVSSASGWNNYQPTPLEEGTAAYDRVMDKLAGSYQ